MANANTAAKVTATPATATLPKVAEKLDESALAKLNIPSGVFASQGIVDSIASRLAIACMLVKNGQSQQSNSGQSLLHGLTDRQKLELAESTEVQTLFRDRVSTKRKSLTEVVDVSTMEYCNAVLAKELKRVEVMSEQDRKTYMKKAAEAFINSVQ